MVEGPMKVSCSRLGIEVHKVYDNKRVQNICKSGLYLQEKINKGKGTEILEFWLKTNEKWLFTFEGA